MISDLDVLDDRFSKIIVMCVSVYPICVTGSANMDMYISANFASTKTNH